MDRLFIEHLSTSRRQSPVAVLMNMGKFLRRFIRTMWFIVVYVLIGRKDNFIFELSMSMMALIVGFWLLVASILAYLRYRYSVDEDSVQINFGVIARRKVDIPFERIQNVNFEQGIVQRIFGVVSLQIDTAGSAGSEVLIDALPRKEAEAIRDYILEQKRVLSPLAENAEGTAEANEGDSVPSVSGLTPDRELLHLKVADLLKVGVSQNHFRTAAVIFGLGYSFFDDFQEVFEIDVLDIVAERAGVWAQSFTGMSLLFLIIAFSVTMARTLLSYFDLRFCKSQDGFKVTSGLFNRQETALRKEKIQIITWTTNPLRRIFGIYTLDIKQAVAKVVANRKRKVEIPGCYQHQVDEVLRSCFPDYAGDEPNVHSIDFSITVRRTIYLGLLPALAAFAIYYFTMELPVLLAAIFWPLVVFGLLYVYHRKFKIFAGEEYIRIQKGIFGTSQAVMPYYKIQAVQTVQSIYQRRKGLANLQIHTANGMLTIPYLDLEKTRWLRNYMLSEVEQSERQWM